VFSQTKVNIEKDENPYFRNTESGAELMPHFNYAIILTIKFVY